MGGLGGRGGRAARLARSAGLAAGGLAALEVVHVHVHVARGLCGNQIFNPTSMCAYATVLMQALRLCFDNSTRALDSSKNQPNRLRFDRAREFSSLVRTPQTSGWNPHRQGPGGPGRHVLPQVRLPGAECRRPGPAAARLPRAKPVPGRARRRPGQQKGAKFPTSKAHISAVFHSFRLIFGRAIISRNCLEAWMCFPQRARAEHSR